jgi:hypothetical protein
MKIQRRIVDVKRHTKGFIIDGKRVTRGAAVKLAQRNHIAGVNVRRGPRGLFIASKAYSGSLYNLPVRVEGKTSSKRLAVAFG